MLNPFSRWRCIAASALVMVACAEQERNDVDAGLPEPPVEDANTGGNNGVDESDSGTPTPTMAEPRNPRTGVYEDFLDALDADRRALCECRHTELGFEDAEACFEAIRTEDFERSCSIAAFEQDPFMLGARYACLTTARLDFVTCVDTGGCEQLDACKDVLDTERGACGLFPIGPLITFADQVTACEAPDRFGTASVCPEQMEESEGNLVFTGSTTGKGDDQTLSCADPEFPSPDVALEWTAPAAGTYLLDTGGSQFLTALAVLDGCDGATLACAAPFGSDVGEAALFLDVVAGQTVIIIVEGKNQDSSGYFVVNINPM